jgi:hypothetical protein
MNRFIGPMEILELLKVNDLDRNIDWENKFLNGFTNSDLIILDEEPKTGPDGWPYLMVKTVTDQSQGESAQKVLYWLSQRGIGAVINPKNPYPDYILDYGMIWNFRETGLFINRKAIPSETSEQFEIDFGKDFILDPDAKTLPSYVRGVLKDFFKQQNILNPEIAQVVRPSENTNFSPINLVLNLDSLGNPSPYEYQGIAAAVSWFLPQHYSLLLFNKTQFPKFFSL